MDKLSFEDSQRLWIRFMVTRIAHNIEYGKTLGVLPVLSYEEWCKPDLYYIDGINQMELPIRWNGTDYSASQLETFQEWFHNL